MRFVFTKRFLALATSLAALAAFAAFLGGGTGAMRTLATNPPGTTPNLTGVSCADVFIDSGFLGTPTGTTAFDLNGINGAGDDGDITSLVMTRIEPHQPSGSTWDVTTVTYLGDDAGGLPLVPDGPPGPGCQTSSTAAASAAETNRFGGPSESPYANQYGVRPTALATYTPTGGGNGDLTFSTCSFSESQGKWIRTDSTSHLTKTGPGSKNNGEGVLYLGSGAPSSGGIDTNGDTVIDATTVPTSCDVSACSNTLGAACFAYYFISRSHSRDPRTDHPLLPKNTGKPIAEDPNGPHPKAKGTEQVKDTADGLADDWDGDGCPDWDELDKGWMYHGTSSTPLTPPLGYPPDNDWTTHPVNGTDPFNPYDCDSNWTSTISLTTTIVHNTGGAGTGTNAAECTTGGAPACNGQYFSCLGSMDHTKSGSPNPLAFKLGCYSDSTVTVVQSSNPLTGGASGTSTAVGSGTPGTLTHSTATWTANQFAGYTVTSGGKTMVIASNTATVLTGTTAWVGGAPMIGAYTITASTCPPAPSYLCGDGKVDAAPPGCVANPADANWCKDATAGTGPCPALPCQTNRFSWTAIDPATYPVVSPTSGNDYNPTTNQIHFGGCFAGFGGGTFGNVFGSSAIDAHTGAGSFSIYLNQTLSDCQNATPVVDAPSGRVLIPGTVTIVELRTEKNLTPDLKYDSDRDGCSDASELGNAMNAQTTGGFRDPYNKFDFFNPLKSAPLGSQTIGDVLLVVQKYNKNQGNPLYITDTDRSGILGAQSWNLGAPDGLQGIVDVLAAVKQYNHNCPLVVP